MKKRTVNLAILLSTLMAAQVTSADTVSTQSLEQEGKGVIKALASQLGKELKTTAKSEGLPAAIKVCNTQAQPITQQVSDAKGWDVARTSLKLRNPSNAPDAWERRVLEYFATQKTLGADLKTLAYSEVTTDESGQQVFRMMKAIPVSQQCLACHGGQLKPGIKAKLDELYPYDSATGFKAGDLRGAFTLKKML